MSGYNYFTNPSVETNTTGYSASNATLAQNSAGAQPGAGTYCLAVTATGSNPSVSVAASGLTVGNRYNVSLYTKSTAVIISVSVSGVVSSVSTISPASIVNTWSRIRSTFTATATSHTFTVSSTGSTGTVFYVDRFKLTDGEFPGAYFDGSYPYSTWSGVAFASTSYCAGLDFNISNPGLEEPVLADGYCLNSLAYNNVTKTGRYTIPALRGSNDTITSRRGLTYAPNRPSDVGLWVLSMYVLGCLPDGTMPPFGEQRLIFENNYTQILQQCVKTTNPTTLVAWQVDGTCRTTQVVIDAGFDATMFMGGRRAELSLPFEILPGVWADYVKATTTGTASASWSNQALSMPLLAGGQATIEDAVVTVTGPITNPRVTDITSNVWVQYTGTVPAGQTWVVDVGNFTSKVNGTSVLNLTTHGGHPKFLIIDPGQYGRVPSITLTGSATTSATNISVTAARQHFVA